jgi:hypothetical protein
MWNGYTEDTWVAAATCKETWEDERLWFPKLVSLRYGAEKKTRAQIIAEHCVKIDKGARRIIAKKDGKKLKVIVYRNDAFWIRRMEELRSHAAKTWHEKLFKESLDMRDRAGKTAWIAACENNTLGIVNYLIKKGVNIHQETNRGETGGELAYNTGKNDGKSVWARLTELGVKYIVGKVEKANRYMREYRSREEIFDYWQNLPRIPEYEFRDDFRDDFNPIQQYIYLFKEPVKQDTPLEAAIKRQKKQERAAAPEKKKSSLYKQQFGAKR